MKRVFVILLVAIAVFSCQKREVDPDTIKQDVIFTGVDRTTDGQKSTDYDCDNPPADYASVLIDGTTYRPAVFYIQGVPYTQSIKLTPDTYTVNEFMLMSDKNTPQDLSDDEVVKAVPITGSQFADYIDKPLPFSFSVEPFKKIEVPIEVICFDEADYTAFGFNWFQMTEIIIREQVFFGDLCVNHPVDYEGSMYESQLNGVQVDMPAICRIDVYRNGAFLVSYDNEAWFGEGQPLEIQYPDHLNAADHFDLELYVLVKACGGFEYMHFYSWSFDDDEMIVAGSDNVVDFVLGDCSSGSDLTMPPYISLPISAKAQVKSNGSPGPLGSFFDYQLKQIPDGYKIYSGKWPGWSGHHQMFLQNGDQDADVYSSLCPNLPSIIDHSILNWTAVNWLMNNLDMYPGYDWEDLQCAIWLITDPDWDGLAHGLTLSNLAEIMYNDAIANGGGYSPPAGGVAAVIFVHSSEPAVNLLFVDVDN